MASHASAVADGTSVLIVTHDRPELLRLTLESLAAGVLPRNYTGTLVIENGASEESRTAVDEFHRCLDTRWLRYPTPNKAAALNHGLRQVGSFVVFFDDDVAVGPDTVRQYADAACGLGPGHYFGGRTAVRYATPPSPWLEPHLPVSARGLDRGDRRLAKPGQLFLGLNWAAFTGDLLRVGGFDPRFGPGSRSGATGQETSGQHRLARAGIVGVYLPECLVTHRIPRERCRPRWVLARAYRQGVEDGLRRADNAPGISLLARSACRLSQSLCLTGLSLASLQKRRAFPHMAANLRSWGVLAGVLWNYRYRLTASGDGPESC